MDNGYIKYYWMNQLLSGTACEIFAVIYSFNSVESEQCYYGSQGWLASQLGVSRKTINQNLAWLVENQYIIKTGKGYKPNYEFIDECYKRLQSECNEKIQDVLQKVTPPVTKGYTECNERLHNNIVDNKDNNKAIAIAVQLEDQVKAYLTQQGKSDRFITAFMMWLQKVKKPDWTLKIIQYKLVDLYKLYDDEEKQIQSIMKSWDRAWCSFYNLPKAKEKGDPPPPLEKETTADDDYEVEFGEVV